MKNSETVELIHFWPDGYIGHTDANGKDIGKEFLQNLLSEQQILHEKNIRMYSHFFPEKKYALFRKVKQAFMLDAIKKRKKMYGYSTYDYKLNENFSNIWYTSENLRPPLDMNFKAFLSHDLDQYDGRNTYLPIWATRLGVNLLDAENVQTSMLNKRPILNIPRREICAVISNPEPVRMAFISELQKYFSVDVFGALGNPIDNKEDVLRKYKLNVCFENDEFPGYVTEKPIEAWIGGCIPIWRGLDTGNYLNNEAMVNVSELGFKVAIDKIAGILNDDDEYRKISSLPILRKGYDFQGLRRNLSELCSA